MNKEAILEKLDFRSVYSSHIPFLRGDPQASGRCPFPSHDDIKPSFSVDLTTGLFNCHGCDKQGDVFIFFQELYGVDFKTTLRRLAYEVGIEKPKAKKKVVVLYEYIDEVGNLLYQVLRYEPKDFCLRHKGADGNWIYSLKGVRKVLYNLPEVMSGQVVIIVEGEKDAGNLRALGYTGSIVVTTSIGGAKGWHDDYVDCLAGKDVVIIPDRDKQGVGYAETVARSLHGKAASIRIVELAELGGVREKQGQDISDWITMCRKDGQADSQVKEKLNRLIEEASEWAPLAQGAHDDHEGAYTNNMSTFAENEHLRNFDKGFVMLDTVKPESVEWLWGGYIPLGKLTVIDGDPGLGKSTVTLNLVARVSRGDSMPDGSPGVLGGAVLLTLEDGLGDTIVPRLEAAGADLTRIVAIQAVHDEDDRPHLPTVKDLEAIKQACEKVQAKIIVIDPIMAHLDGKVNSWRDQDVRGVLNPLCQLAEELGVSIVVVRHLNKASGGQAIYRGGGSIGIIGAARCAYLVATDPENEGRRVLAGIKNNLAPMPVSLSFSIEGVGGVSMIAWSGISKHDADTLLAVPSSPEEGTALEEAKDFLKDLLAAGPVKAIVASEGAKSAGIAPATLRRAKKALGVRVEKQSFEEGWVWVLSHEDAQVPSKALIQNIEHLG